MTDIFVSYSQRDHAIVHAVTVALQERGASFRYDSLETCEYFLLAMSPRAVDSSKVRSATAAALMRDKKICVLIVEETALTDFLFVLDAFTVKLTRPDQTNFAVNELADHLGIARAGLARLPESIFVPDDESPDDHITINLSENQQQAMFFTATELTEENPGGALFLYRFMQQYAPDFADGRLGQFADQINQGLRQACLMRLEMLAEEPSKQHDWQGLAALVTTMRGIDIHSPITSRWQLRLNEGFLNDLQEQAKRIPFPFWTKPNPALNEIIAKMSAVSPDDHRTRYVRDRMELALMCEAIYAQAKAAFEAGRPIVVARLMNHISTQCPDYGDPDGVLHGAPIRSEFINNLKSVAKLEGHTSPIQALVFSPDNSLLISGGGDGTLRLWDMVDLQQVAVQRRDDGAIDSLAFSQDGQFLVSTSRSSVIRIWSMPEGREAVTLDQFRAHVTSAIFTQDASALVCGYDNGRIEVIDINSGKIISAINAHRYAITRIHFSSDYSLLFTASEDRIAKIWTYSPRSQEHIMIEHTLQGHLMLIQEMAVSSDDHLVVTAANDGRIKLWNTETGSTVVTLTHGEGIHVRAVALSPQAPLLASGGSDRLLHIWDTNTGNKVRTLTMHTGAINALAFTPDGTTLATGASDHYIHVWRLR